MPKIIILLAALSLLFLSSCGSSTESSENSKFTEQVSENEFHNAYFKMAVQKPEEWTSLDHSTEAELQALATELTANEGSDLRAILKASEKNEYTLFSLFQYAPGYPVEINPSVLGVAERVSQAPGIKTGKDYFFHAKKLMSQANPDYSFSVEYFARKIGGVVFDQMDATITFAGQTTNQSYYATKYNDFIILIVESYGDEQSRSETEKTLEGITFDW